MRWTTFPLLPWITLQLLLTLARMLRRLYRQEHKYLPGILGEKGELVEEMFINLSVVQEADQRAKEDRLLKDKSKAEEEKPYGTEDWEALYSNKRPIEWHSLFKPALPKKEGLEETKEQPKNPRQVLMLGRAVALAKAV